MRILVLQLARFGDIYQSWPAIKALQRSFPGAEVHALVRSRFSQATEGLAGVTVHELNTADVLKPILESGDENAALSRLSDLIERLEALRFDRIINLSFSPFSSYLTNAIAGPGAT